MLFCIIQGEYELETGDDQMAAPPGHAHGGDTCSRYEGPGRSPGTEVGRAPGSTGSRESNRHSRLPFAKGTERNVDRASARVCRKEHGGEKRETRTNGQRGQRVAGSGGLELAACFVT